MVVSVAGALGDPHVSLLIENLLAIYRRGGRGAKSTTTAERLSSRTPCINVRNGCEERATVDDVLVRIAPAGAAMLMCVLFTNPAGNILLERFYNVPAEERLHWRSFLVKLGTDNLSGAHNEELFVASHKSVYVVYTAIGEICIFLVGKDEYDELALSEVLYAITSSVKDVCKKAPSERTFLEKYGRVCLSLDEIVLQGSLEHTDKDRIRRLTRMKPLVD